MVEWERAPGQPEALEGDLMPQLDPDPEPAADVEDLSAAASAASAAAFEPAAAAEDASAAASSAASIS